QQPTPSALPTVTASSTLTNIPSTSTFTLTPLLPTETSTPLPTETIRPSPIPVVERLKARVTADLLSCRYGPGTEYLYLYALRRGANIELIGRTDANHWVWVDGTNKCWVNSNFLEIAGEPMSLPVVYPGIAKLPITPYYPAPGWVNATRKGNSVEVTWEAVLISPGKFEDENMHQYIVEVWRCENGQILFETLGTNFPFITIANDETGCDLPSHGNVWLQEKHGFAGPLEIPWPAQ
ncbi:MAG TPA: hypothetical protein VJ785_09080, partial [Anaerolineales bacterium]|nr:hypothetical protein [Anaerolineales bacterium]